MECPSKNDRRKVVIFSRKALKDRMECTGCLRQAPLHDSPTLRTMQKKSETASLVRKLPRRVPLYFCMARSYANFPLTKL